MATQLGLPASSVLLCRIGRWLHDLGKGALPDNLLSKRGPLDDQELAMMRMHPVVGEQLVRRIGGLEDAAPILRHHHERFDGQGYPDGLRGAHPDRGAHRGCRRGVLGDDLRPCLPERTRPVGRHRGAVPEAGAQFDPEVVAALQTVLAADLERIRDELEVSRNTGGQPPGGLRAVPPTRP